MVTLQVPPGPPKSCELRAKEQPTPDEGRDIGRVPLETNIKYCDARDIGL
jgi:hypothetical protein